MYIPNIKDNNFDDLVMNSKQINLIHFSADFCSPCKEYSLFLMDLAKKDDSDFVIGEVDVMLNTELRKMFDIRLLPTTIFFYEGDILERKEGILSLDDINEILYNA